MLYVEIPENVFLITDFYVDYIVALENRNLSLALAIKNSKRILRVLGYWNTEKCLGFSTQDSGDVIKLHNAPMKRHILQVF